LPEEKASVSALASFAQLGAYFQLVSIVPASVVVLTVFVLMAGGAPGRRPRLDAIAQAVRSINFPVGVGLALAIVVVGMALHPFQYTATQFLEGYWGQSRIGRQAMLSRSRIHHARWRRYVKGATISDAAFDNKRQALSDISDCSEISPGEQRRAEVELLEATINRQGFYSAFERYPTAADLQSAVEELMPTRLGNTLRRFENRAGQPFGLHAPAVIPYILKLAPPQEIAYIDDARGELDLAVRFVLTWVLVAVVSFILLWPYGSWLAVPLVSYGLVWVSYRAAVHAAESYGSALSVLIDLNYPVLLDRLRVPSPSNLKRLSEIEAWVQRQQMPTDPLEPKLEEIEGP
jgi:hypothetical protein